MSNRLLRSAWRTVYRPVLLLALALGVVAAVTWLVGGEVR